MCSENLKLIKCRQVKQRLESSVHTHLPSPMTEKETVEFLCGYPPSIDTFVHTLRPKEIPRDKIMPIVILHTCPPDEETWSEIAIYPEVYIVIGDPLETRDLV